MIMKTAITGANIKKNHMDILWHEYADKTDPTFRVNEYDLYG